MHESKQNKLPQIIVEYILKLNDKKLPFNNRELCYIQLQRVVEACSHALATYDSERSKLKNSEVLYGKRNQKTKNETSTQTRNG